MAIVQTGSTLTFAAPGSTNTGTVSTTITVPADAEIVVVGWSGYGGTANYFSGGKMQFTKGGVDTDMVSVAGGDADISDWQGALFYLALPDTGTNKTLKWDWSGTADASSVDTLCSVTFWKGIDTASPVRGSSGGQAAGIPYTSGTITALSGDLIIAWAFGNVPSEGTINSWSNLSLLTQIAMSAGADAAWATGSPSGNTTVAASTATNFNDGGIVAISLKPATGGAAKPPTKYDWPVPRGQSVAPSVLSWIKSQIPPPATAKPFTKTDQSNPIPPPLVLRDWVSQGGALRTPPPPRPFTQRDQSNPLAAPIWLRDWVSRSAALLAAPAGQPFSQEDQSNPRALVWQSTSWMQAASQALTAKPPPTNYDWPASRLVPTWPRDWVSQPNALLAAPAQKPFTQSDWSNPRTIPPAVQDWSARSAALLAPAAAVAMPFTQMDFSNPRSDRQRQTFDFIPAYPYTGSGPAPAGEPPHNRYFFADVGRMMSMG